VFLGERRPPDNLGNAWEMSAPFHASIVADGVVNARLIHLWESRFKAPCHLTVYQWVGLRTSKSVRDIVE
jgi:hypothetical protein